VLVVVARLLAAALGRNHDVFASVVQGIDDPFLGIVSFVGNDRGRWPRRVTFRTWCLFQ
jgi:hypothetical protein